MRLKNKVCLITGGTSGIGLATAKGFLEEGALVAICGRSQGAIDEAQNSLGKNVFAMQTDITNISDLDKMYEATVEHFGKIDA